MRTSIMAISARLLTGAGLSAITLGMTTAPASASAVSISVPAMPMAQALQQIAAQSGTAVAFDPDAVAGLQSAAVQDEKNVESAIRAAIHGQSLTVTKNPKGGLMVANSIVVTAHRDEAETSYMVRQSSSSSRMGQSLREQARNAQVISAKVLAEQQAQTIPDALRNAGGVMVNTATVQGGTAYSVRGFSSGGVLNGMPSANNNGVAAGVTQSIANVERVEVLKGPDSLLAGVGNLGGTINVVTKKPSADPYLYVSAETGSFGHVRGTIDASNALTDDRKLSARVIATAAHDDHNHGGYRGDEDYLFAPSIRYKDALTDVTLGLTTTNQIFGLTPFTPLNPVTNTPLDRPRDQPIISADQGIRTKTTQLYGDFTHKVSDWLTVVARGQHQKLSLDLDIFTPIALLDPGAGLLLVMTGASRQEGTADALDSFARFNVATGPVKHTLNVGYTYTRNKTTSFSASGLDFVPYLLDEPGTSTLAPVDTKDYDLTATQNGFYAQYLAEFWKLHLIAGVRHNKFRSKIVRAWNGSTGIDEGNSTTPNFGAVLDITDNISAFASYAFGYSPIFTLDREGNKLPDTKTRNLEGGVKIDLFHDRMFFTGSWFRLKQSNLIITDPTDWRYSVAVPGQVGKGIDMSLTGEILKGWSVMASFTRTNYKYLNSSYGTIVAGQARDQYSLYSSYRYKLNEGVEGGLGAGIYGRSSAPINTYGTYSVPASRQVDLNGFLKIGMLDVNLGVRNVFDRGNYGITRTSQFIPISEPRTWRLTIGYRFQ